MPEIRDDVLKAPHNRCLIARKDERLSTVLSRLQAADGGNWWHLIVDWGNGQFRAITFAGLAKQLANAPSQKVLEPLANFDLPAARAVDKFSRGTAAAEDLARQQPNDLVVVTQQGQPIGLLYVGNLRSTRSVEVGPNIMNYYSWETLVTKDPKLPEAAEPAIKAINVWIDAPVGDPMSELRVGRQSPLAFKVGDPVIQNLLDPATARILETDIPPTGLNTHWVINSCTARLEPASAAVSVTTTLLNQIRHWQAEFDLHIPKTGESATVRMLIEPITAEGAQLEVILLHGEVYRKFSVHLNVSDDMRSTRAFPQASAGPVIIRDDVQLVRGDQVRLSPPHEWQTPGSSFSLTLNQDNSLLVYGESINCGDGRVVDIPPQRLGSIADKSEVAQPVDNLRNTAEAFRAKFENYLNDIDPDELMERLKNFTPTADWATAPDRSDQQHRQVWDQVRQSTELRELANQGRILYDTLFPMGSEVRRWLDCLHPGSRINVYASLQKPSWIPDIPWALLYTQDANTQPAIDPLCFWGLRFRIQYMAHATAVVSRNLGHPRQTYRGHGLYWGGSPSDIAVKEALWQRRLWSKAKQNILAPAQLPVQNPGQELFALFGPSAPRPMPVLYFYCQCATDARNNLLLRFGGTNQPPDVLKVDSLSQQPMADRPLIFANACTTTASDPYRLNTLEAYFFRQQCRAFLGTVTKVPIQFASRFAVIFFHFFYRQADPAPISAGESVAQTRLFLWTEYRNLGGLFYAYINHYDLFMADDAELQTLRH